MSRSSIVASSRRSAVRWRLAPRYCVVGLFDTRKSSGPDNLGQQPLGSLTLLLSPERIDDTTSFSIWRENCYHSAFQINSFLRQLQSNTNAPNFFRQLQLNTNAPNFLVHFAEIEQPLMCPLKQVLLKTDEWKGCAKKSLMICFPNSNLRLKKWQGTRLQILSKN